MPTTSQDAGVAESPKKSEDGEGGKEMKDDKQEVEASQNGDAVKDKKVTKEDDEDKESNEMDKARLVNEATTLLAQGKRHLFVKDYPTAVATLGEACGKFSELYGELADECADVYFNYGCALLELAREESGVLEVDNKDKESEDDEEEEEASDSKDEVEDEEKPTKSETEPNNSDTNKTDDEKEEQSTEGKADEEGEEAPADNADEEAEEDVNNLQLAWEMFELAKVIFTRQTDEKKLADTYLRLGEVALESENYGTAINDIQSCLDLQKKVLPPVSREIAETLFQLGVACSLCNQFDDAIKHFTAAGVLLEKRIQNLGRMTEPEPEKASNPFYSLEKEIEELKAVLPEIKDKIADMEDFRNETMNAVVQATINNKTNDTVDGAGPSTNGTSSSVSSSSSSSTSKAPINDISHLVRKKRKNPEDANVASNIEPKKPNSELKKAT